MERQFRLRKSLELIDDVPRVRVLHHFAADSGIARMQRNIQWANAAADDTIQLAFVQIRQGHVVPHDERHAPVVVLYVQARSTALWHLVDKAEHTVVLAGAHRAHQARGKRQSERLVVVLFERYGFPLAALLLNIERQVFGGG
ncbi:hypothetical protein SDC9_109882 [bioreactor metagenome]|uniref:Uncharacterized protein n=1 Tax=bioreactor metagenome TaxID=1076179 RepID=A0A645BMI8_9ZZZZ